MTAAISLAAFTAACAVFPYPASAPALSTLHGYVSLLMRWNRVMNLVGARTWQTIIHTLIVDSFYLATFLDSLALPPNPKMWDLGAGAGLPGIPLRILWQQGDYTMIEAREKRAIFIDTVLAQYPLPATQVVCARVDNFFAMVTHKADAIISRAFMPWAQLVPLVQEQLVSGGRLIIFARTPPPELLPAPLAALWHIEASYAYTVQGGQRWFWCLAL